MNQNQVFSYEILKGLGECKNDFLDFDLSSLDINEWTFFCNSLLHHGYKTIKGLGFNYKTLVNHEFKSQQMSEFGSPTKRRCAPPLVLESSVQRILKKPVSELIGLLSRIIPKTKTISILQFTSIPISIPDIDILCQSIFQCSPLRSLRLQDIKLSTEGFSLLCESMKKQGIVEFQARKCQLNDESIPSLADLIDFHSKLQKEAERKRDMACNNKGILQPLMFLDLRDNEFTNEFIYSLTDLIEQSTLSVVYMSGNIDIDPDIVDSPKILFSQKDDPVKNKLVTQTKIDHLRQENQRLKAILAEITENNIVVPLPSGIYAVGNRAPDLSDHVQTLEVLHSKIKSHDPEFVPKKITRRSKSVSRLNKTDL